MKFEIQYELRTTRIMLIEANSEEEAIEKYRSGDYVDDEEEDVLDSRITEVRKAEE